MVNFAMQVSFQRGSKFTIDQQKLIMVKRELSIVNFAAPVNFLNA